VKPRPAHGVAPSRNRRRTAILTVIAGVALSGCLAPRPFDEAAWRARVEATREEDLEAPHRTPSGRFFNPWLPMEDRTWDFWRWVLTRNSFGTDREGEGPSPAVANDGAYLRNAGEPPSVTAVGHATFVVHWGGQVVVTDPFFGKRAVIPPRLVPAPFGPSAIPDGAVVVISHNHYDHLDASSIEALAPRCRFLCPPGLGEFVRRRGARDVVELDWWQVAEVDGTTFTFLPAQHWSRRFGMGLNETLWGSWLMERGGRKVFFGGDSGYFKGYRVFGSRYPGIDVALIGIGAYAPRWFMHYAHMDVAETVRAFRELGARMLVPTQSGVLGLGDEPASRPVLELERAAAADPWLRERLRVLPVGGRLFLDGGNRRGEHRPEGGSPGA
jgi:L-ascorbate metabolism protein UlaG (beta-lactamase superfamily)